MAAPIYYQWQNEHLLRTIYPLREMKLRDFLVYGYEIELWGEYKEKTLQDLGGEVQAHRAAQKELVSTAYDRYVELRAYFEKDEVSEEYRRRFPDVDQEFLEKINRMHREFNRYFPTYKNIAKEKYFLTSQIAVMEGHRKEIDRQIANMQRILRNMGLDWKKTPEYQQGIEKRIQVTTPMANQELEKLYAFLSAFVKVEKWRNEIKSWKAKNVQAKTGITSRFGQLSKEKASLEEKLGEIKSDLARLKSPTGLEKYEAYFTREEISADYQWAFPNLDRKSIEKINGVHRWIKSYFNSHPNPQHRILFLKERIRDLQIVQREIEKEISDKERTVRNMGETWQKTPVYRVEIQVLRNVSLEVVLVELILIKEYLATLEISGKTAAEIQAAIAESEAQRSQVERRLGEVNEALDSIEEQSRKIEAAINRSEKEQLLAFVDLQNVGVREVVRGKVERYQNILAGMDHDQLLEEIVKKFLADTGRYPLWLQYMVIHFSGMRYKSAHGSWADPKDLLFALQVKEIEKNFKLKDDDTIDALCQEKIADYRPGFSPNESSARTDVEGYRVPKLALTQDPKWKAKVEHHLNRLEKAVYPYHKRKALLDLLIDEESYEIEALKDKEALEILEGKKAELPPWMWNEVVRLTDLKLTEVKEDDWEELSPDDLAARQDYRDWEFREILDKWKRENLTGWREEHDRANRLIVSRAVCNEVAEHIQHLRGNSVPGGLTAKPEWYLRKEKDPKLSERADPPYFVKPRSQADFKEGASILWLRYVDRPPNAWQVAHPLRLKNGEGLLASMASAGRGEPKAQNNRGRTNSKGAGKNKNNKPSGGRYLRWIHEATVAEVGETADGPVVLTFETALPYEDKRQSTIGVFKHSASNLVHNPAAGVLSFVGYTPKEDVPYEDLKEMLDWNKILRRQVLSEAQVEAYWDNRIRLDQQPAPRRDGKPATPKPPVGAPARKISPAEIAPPLERVLHKERVVCYEIDPGGKQAKVYSPRVELRRGLRLWVDRGKAVRVANHTYLPVVRCDGEPRAQELYVRAEAIVDLPDERASFPVEAREKLHFRKVSAANKSGKPIMEPISVQIPAGTKLRISAVHKVTPGDPGTGLIDADGPDDYYLVAECPTRVSAEGLFVRTRDVIKISEEAYQSRDLKPAKEDDTPSFMVDQVRYALGRDE